MKDTEKYKYLYGNIIKVCDRLFCWGFFWFFLCLLPVSSMENRVHRITKGTSATTRDNIRVQLETEKARKGGNPVNYAVVLRSQNDLACFQETIHPSKQFTFVIYT